MDWYAFLFFIEVTVSGLLSGVMYAMVAIGFVLIYKTSGVLNFAQGAMVLFAALTFVSLVERGLPFLAALAATVLLISGSSACAADPAPRSAPQVDYVATYVWSMDDDTFGGFSGIEISPDGSRFTVLSDRATLRWGHIERDTEGRIFADPAKVHEIGHKGRFFEVPGYGLTEPSPQRTPLIYQAGASGGKSGSAGASMA